MDGVPARVLDLFAATGPPEPLEGGRGLSVRVGDLVLSPGGDERVAIWLCPVQARLAVRLDERRGRRSPGRSLRLALPVPARDGSWVVDGWAATRFEPDATPCTDLGVLRATGHLLHAELAVAVPRRPGALDGRDDRWARADHLVWSSGARVPAVGAVGALAGRLLALREPLDLPSQLVHGDLAGNVLLDASGVPFVLDLAPYWRPPGWADAVTVLDAVLWQRADPDALAGLGRTGRQLVLRAVLFRLLSDEVPAPTRYAAAARTAGLLES